MRISFQITYTLRQQTQSRKPWQEAVGDRNHCREAAGWGSYWRKWGSKFPLVLFTCLILCTQLLNHNSCEEPIAFIVFVALFLLWFFFSVCVSCSLFVCFAMQSIDISKIFLDFSWLWNDDCEMIAVYFPQLFTFRKRI